MSGGECEGCLEWKEYDVDEGQTPDYVDAVFGGASHDSFLYVGRVRPNDIPAVLPAAVPENDNKAYYTWDTSVGESGKFELLISKSYEWVDGWQAGEVPDNAVLGGWCSDEGTNYYIGRVLLDEGKWAVPGRIDPANKAIYISYNKEEKSYESYQVLVCTCQNGCNCKSQRL